MLLEFYISSFVSYNSFSKLCIKMHSSWLIFDAVKALENKSFLLFNLDFANYTIFLFFLYYWPMLLNSFRYYSNSNGIAELVIAIGIPTKEAKSEMETQPVIIENTINEWLI